MDDPPINQRDYVRRLLEAYRATPGTSGAVRRPDRLLAAQLHERGVPLEAVENAFVLAATRRMIRTADAAPLGTIRSLAYFSPVIEEVLQLQVSQEYFQYLRHKLQHAATARYKPAPSPNEIPHHTQRASGADEIAAYPRRNGRTPAAWTMRAHPRSCSWNGSLQPSATGSLLVSSEEAGALQLLLFPSPGTKDCLPFGIDSLPPEQKVGGSNPLGRTSSLSLSGLPSQPNPLQTFCSAGFLSTYRPF